MENDFILVLDLGGPEAVSMARKLRNQRYYTEVLSRSADAELLLRKSPRGILVAGGESAGVDSFPRAVLSLGVPVLALGGAARMLALAEGAVSGGTQLTNQVAQISFQPCDLFNRLSVSDRYLNRIDAFELPEGFQPIATTLDGLVPGFADFQRSLYALQFYAESNDPDGAAILSNFAERVCGCTPFWSMESYIEREIRYIQDRVGQGRALLTVSGGVDSATCALLMRRAIGDQLTCAFVDNGLLRAGEAEKVLTAYREELGIEPMYIDARSRFLGWLKGLEDPAEKRRAIHNEFINLFTELFEATPDLKFLAQGTIYSDLLDERIANASPMTFEAGELIEPLRMLFKDEVRMLAESLGLPRSFIDRQPFPSPGLALRCCGEVTRQKLDLLRRADAIFHEEICAAGQDRRLSQYFTVLTNTLAQGSDGRRTEALVLRAVSGQSSASFTPGRLPHDLLDRTAQRIAREVPGIGRIVYDITGSESAAVEWE